MANLRIRHSFSSNIQLMEESLPAIIIATMDEKRINGTY